MGRVGRNLVLLCAAFLVISSAAYGVPDEGKQLRKHLGSRPFLSAGPLDEIPDVGEAIRDVKAWPGGEETPAVELDRESDVEIRDLKGEEEETKPEGVAAKVWSYLSGFKTPLFGNGFVNPAGSSEKSNVVRTEEQGHGHGRKHRHKHGHHHGVFHSFFGGIRDSIRKRPERNAAGTAASEPLVLGDGAPSAAGFAAKMTGVVGKVLEEYYASSVTPEEATTCVGILEEQVMKLVKSLKSALEEQICEEGVSLPEQKFCNLLSFHPKMATLMVFAKADVNPVTVALMRTSTAGCCTSAKDNGNLLGGVKHVETLARHLPVHMLTHHLNSLYNNEPNEHHVRMCHKHKLEHKEHDQKDRSMFGMFHRHSHDHEEHDREEQDMPRKHEHDHKEHDHEDHHMFGMIHKLKREYEERKKHRELEHGDEEGRKHWWHQERKIVKAGRDSDSHDDENSCKECFVRGVRHLARGIRMHLAATCHSATCPKLIAACTFAMEHKFLTKTYLAVKIPIWEMVAFHCKMMRRESRRLNAPNFEVDHIGREFDAEHGEDPTTVSETNVLQDLHLGNEIPLTHAFEPHFPRPGHWMSGACAKHRVYQLFRRGLQLRGNVVGISNKNENAEDKLPGLVRTHLVVLRGPIHPENFQDALANAQVLDAGNFRDMFSDIQDQMTKLVGAVVDSESGTGPDLKHEVMLLKPLHQHHNGRTHVRNFRISARPNVIPAGEDNEQPGLLSSLKDRVRDFRISARPRAVPLSEGKEVPAKVEDNDESTHVMDSKIELPDTNEDGRAEM